MTDLIENSEEFWLRQYKKFQTENQKLKDQLAELRLTIPHIDKRKDSYIKQIKELEAALLEADEGLEEYNNVFLKYNLDVQVGRFGLRIRKDAKKTRQSISKLVTEIKERV